jgi:hypothetical protein
MVHICHGENLRSMDVMHATIPIGPIKVNFCLKI